MSGDTAGDRVAHFGRGLAQDELAGGPAIGLGIGGFAAAVIEHDVARAHIFAGCRRR